MNSDTLNPAAIYQTKVRSRDRLEQLKAGRQTRLLREALNGLPEHIRIARTQTLIFFHVFLISGYRRRRVDENGKTSEGQRLKPAVCFEPRLGYPTEQAIRRALRTVRSRCGAEIKQYMRARRLFREAKKRYAATETEESWVWYIAGNGNTSSLAYRQFISFFVNFNPHLSGFKFRYRTYELLPRQAERARAKREIDEALDEMSRHRHSVFAKMGVPPRFRTLI